jgi:hypothetical protein
VAVRGHRAINKNRCTSQVLMFVLEPIFPFNS